MSKNLQDLTGQTFTRLTVLGRAQNGPNGNNRWFCRCSCGKETTVDGNKLRNGHTRSCNCIKGQHCFTLTKTHGMATTGIYKIWIAMVRRCRSPKAISYPNYGARGITVCERWLIFENFYRDMGDRPLGTSLERIDNAGPYSPENCRWATRAEQARNKRDNVWIEIDGRRLVVRDWAHVVGISEFTIYARLNRGWDPRRAVTEPPKTGCYSKKIQSPLREIPPSLDL